MLLFQSFYRQIADSAQANFPRLAEIPPVQWDHLISPYAIELPKNLYQTVDSAIKSLFSVSRAPEYQSKLSGQHEFPRLNNQSVLMAYDFHVSGENAHLVEINTNAAGFLLSVLGNSVHENRDIQALESLQRLKRSFEDEGMSEAKQIALIDDDILNQKMYAEFLMYLGTFQSWNWRALLHDARFLTYSEKLMANQEKIDFVYNRSTDFYFDHPEHQALRQAWMSGAAVVSPQPREYHLLADKERLVDLSRPGWLESIDADPGAIAAIRKVLIPTYEISYFENLEKLWSERRSLFFKPRRMYGGKSVYRGESVSRKVFDRLMHEDTLIQRYCPAAQVPGATVGHPLENWKFDLRFYVYRDQIQQVVARIYRGQVTNFSSPLGGFTRVVFV